MIKTIIVDDEAHCISRLEKLLTSRCREEVAVVGTAQSVQEGEALIERLDPDLVLLDIQIGDRNGFELLSHFPEARFDVVFCTAYEQYALKAFKFSALDYLLKPIDVDDLVELVGRVKAKRDARREERQLLFEMARRNIDGYRGREKRIAIPTVTGLTMLMADEIVRCQSDINYTTIHLADRTSFVVAKTLKDFEEILEPYGFIRIHNSHLVNLTRIKKYHKGKGGYVVLQDGTEIEVSVRKKESLLSLLNNL